MRGIRLVVLLLVMVMLVAGLLVSAGPASADGRQFRETSGPMSALCQIFDFGVRPFPPDRDPWQGVQMHFLGDAWSSQNGQLYYTLLDGHSTYHYLRPANPLMVFHGRHDWNIYPVSSYTTDIGSVTGWYDGQYRERTIADGWEPDPEDPPAVGYVIGEGRGTLTGQTLHMTLVITDYGASRGLCPEGQWPVLNGTLTMQFVGKP